MTAEPEKVEQPAVPLLFVDLDDTVRKGHDELGRWVNGPEDVEVFPEAVEMMRRWKAGGGRIVAVTNQGGIALGHLTQEACMEAILRTHELTGELFDGAQFCPHHPEAKSVRDARCWCRKPYPGMLIIGAVTLTDRTGEAYPPHMSLMVGDRPEDQQAAAAANIDFQWAADWRAQAGVGARG